MARGATFPARWLREPRPISSQPVGLGFPRHAGRYRPKGYSSPGCWSCKSKEGFMIRRWEPILPGVRCLYVRSPANHRSASGTAASTPCRATRRITVFLPRLSELQRFGRISDLGMRPYPPRVELVLFSSPSQSVIARWGWGFHAVQGSVDPGNHHFRPHVVGVVELWKHF